MKHAVSVCFTLQGRIFAAVRGVLNNPKNTIVFESFNGQTITCSPKAIHEAMLLDPRFNSFNFIWSVQDTEKYQNQFPQDRRTTIVKAGSPELKKAMKTSKIWVVNSMLSRTKQPTKKQIYVQTWHGTPFKKLRVDLTVTGKANRNDLKGYQQINWVDVPRYDLMFAQSDYSAEKFQSAFELDKYGKSCALHAIGLPRNDALYQSSPEKIADIKNRLGIPSDKKIVLYAPTWRDNSKQVARNVYAEQTGVDTEALAEALGKDHQLLVRSHYYVQPNGEHRTRAIDVSAIDDINDLYLISDALITDYSSVFFDYALLERPIYFLMKDLDEYENQVRGLYFGIEDLPGPVYREERAVAEAVRTVANPKPKKTFPFENVHDDGNASKRALDLIFEELTNNNR